jgi:hypothetical protein
MTSPRPFYLIIDRFGNIIDFRDGDWKPSDVSPYKVVRWTGSMFVEYFS